MTLGLIGKKLGMTRLYDADGSVVPVTVVLAGPCPILRVKRRAEDGYTALQLGFETLPERKVNKPMAGHFKKAQSEPMRLVREFRLDEVEGFEVGRKLDVEMFKAGEKVDVIGVSKGRGFAGPMKRHHSSRGPESHGSRYHRRPGSMGASSDPSRVFKGKKMPGHMGAARATTQNVKVVRIDIDKNLILLRGSVPGHNNGYVMVVKGKKATAPAGSKAA